MDGPEKLSIDEFINHPSYRQVATFFLGFVFISCIHFTYHLPVAVFRRIRARLLGRKPSGGFGLEANRPHEDEKVNGWLGYGRDRSSSIYSRPESNNLALSLTICFAMGSVAEFGSLLLFKDGGQAGCAFLVAWGGMASQAARLLGLLKLSLDLRKMGVRRWETFVFWAWLIFALVLMFVSNAISIGTLQPITQFADSALCYRKHFVATAVVTSVVDILLEAYCLIRLHYLLVPAFLSTEHKLDAVMDVRTSRAVSLLILDIMSAAPAARFFSVLADVIPASIGTLLVLVAFNQRSPDVTLATTASIPPTRADSLQSRSTIEIKKMPSNRSLVAHDPRISHPFAASALQDPSPETEDWPASASPDLPEKPYLPYPEPARSRRQTWRTSTQRASTQSAVSESDSDIARSVKGAIVAFAFKDHVAQGRKTRERRSFLPAMPSMAELPHDPPRQTLPRSTPLRIPKPIPPAPQAADLERASSSPPPPPSPVPSPSRPQISITTATPRPGTAPHESVALTLSDGSAKSLHLTPSTPARSQPSRRASSDETSSSDWRYDVRHDSLGSSEGSPRRHSAGTAGLPPADDDLSIVYEASHEDSDSLPPSRAYRPTFGEHMFVQGGLGRTMSPPADVPQDVRAEGNSSGSNKSVSSRPAAGGSIKSTYSDPAPGSIKSAYSDGSNKSALSGPAPGSIKSASSNTRI